MEWRARLNRLETLLPTPRGRIPAATMSDEKIRHALAGSCEWLAVELPELPWTDEARRAIDRFWDGSYGLGKDCGPDGRNPWFTVYGYSIFQFQVSLRNLAEECGLALSDFHPTGSDPYWPIDAVDLGPYRWDVGMKYRQTLQEKHGNDHHKLSLEEAQAVADEVRREIKRGANRTVGQGNRSCFPLDGMA